MNRTCLEKLEYNQIINKLSSYCVTYLGKKFANELTPSNDKSNILDMINQTNEGVSVLYKASTPPISEMADITIYLKTLESDGILTLKAILDLANILKQANELKKYFYQDFINPDDFPILNNYFSLLYSNESMCTKIFKCIIDENTVADDASTELKNIRRKQRKIEQDIKSSLNNFLHSHSKYIQENVITIRNDRFVIPVKEEYRSQIKGFTHDISSTGATVFIEPILVFDMNNELNNLKIEEKIEIEKIIKDLSNSFVPYIENLKNDSDIIGTLDFIFGKAKYSKYLNAVMPIINDKKLIDLKSARHPLLNQNTAVPINITIGNDYTSLIITGPNTGGKTVTLKTVGLITLMACSGLNIPTDEGSSIFIFDNVFADIGDDQSISDSLSTFSSHILNISQITKEASSNSLILVDELGSGTDPVEGANLAISILDFFKKLNCITIATTHYQELKKYALVTKGFENASVEFDLETLSPTYKLLIGVPGKSNAFEISKKLGLDETIITNAKALLNSDDIKFETVLKNIYDDKIQIENDKLKIESELSEISILKKKLEKENTEKELKAIELINSAKMEARNILINAKEDANEVIRQINLESSSKTLNNLRNSLNDKINNLQLIKNNSNINTTKAIPKDEIKPNLNVFVTTFNQDGIVLSNVSKSDEVQVQIGNIKTNINIKYLERSRKISDSNKNNNSKKSKNSSYSYNISKTRSINSEINVIGQTVADAVLIVDKFLDDCSLAKLQTARIIHGKGTGKLKSGIHAFLKTNPHVKSFRIGTYGEGEMGVTVVELK